MSGVTRVLATALAIALAGTVAACGSDGKKPAAGTSTSRLTTITGGTTTIRIDPSFVAALGGRDFAPTTFGTAKITSPSEFALPVTGGDVTLDASGRIRGEIKHDGSGLTFTSGSTKATAKDFAIHLTEDPNLTGAIDLNGATAFASLRVFDLDTSTVKGATIKDGVATLSGVTLYLSSAAASDLNLALHTTLTGNKQVKVGTATITATGS
jgi:hypothetical protein